MTSKKEIPWSHQGKCMLKLRGHKFYRDGKRVWPYQVLYEVFKTAPDIESDFLMEYIRELNLFTVTSNK